MPANHVKPILIPPIMLVGAVGGAALILLNLYLLPYALRLWNTFMR